jgi:hypothetical protein
VERTAPDFIETPVYLIADLILLLNDLIADYGSVFNWGCQGIWTSIFDLIGAFFLGDYNKVWNEYFERGSYDIRQKKSRSD